LTTSLTIAPVVALGGWVAFVIGALVMQRRRASEAAATAEG
jgi:hypothetical protein